MTPKRTQHARGRFSKKTSGSHHGNVRVWKLAKNEEADNSPFPAEQDYLRKQLEQRAKAPSVGSEFYPGESSGIHCEHSENVEPSSKDSELAAITVYHGLAIGIKSNPCLDRRPSGNGRK